MTEPGERHWEPGWTEIPSDCGRYTDIVPLETYHNLGDMKCWCKPGIEIVACPKKAQSIIMVKHTLPPHSWVGGDLKDDAMTYSEDTIDEIENRGDEYQASEEIDPNSMVCEVCGCVEDDENTNDGCIGPVYQALDYHSIKPENED